MSAVSPSNLNDFHKTLKILLSPFDVDHILLNQALFNRATFLGFSSFSAGFDKTFKILLSQFEVDHVSMVSILADQSNYTNTVELQRLER